MLTLDPPVELNIPEIGSREIICPSVNPTVVGWIMPRLSPIVYPQCLRAAECWVIEAEVQPGDLFSQM